jgi:hypothetical protein
MVVSFGGFDLDRLGVVCAQLVSGSNARAAVDGEGKSRVHFEGRLGDGRAAEDAGSRWCFRDFDRTDRRGETAGGGFRLADLLPTVKLR